MSRPILLLAFALSLIVGCKSMRLSPTADQNWLRDLERADSIVLRQNGFEQKLADRITIARLANIYANAKWEVYWHTIPGNFGDQTIDIYSNGTRLRRMSYTGVLWEIQRQESHRTASLSDEDCKWIESLFSFVQNGESEGVR